MTALVDVVFPCLNEEAALPWVLGRLPEGYRAIVVDNGSTDRSAEVARSFGATVVSEPRRGFGSAAHAGLPAATAPVVTGEYRLGDVRHITASSARLAAELDWAPSIGFEAGMLEFATAPLRAAVQR